MNYPRIAFLVHGSAASVELVRARGLSRHLPANNALYLTRRATRAETWRHWNEQIQSWRPDLVYVVNTGLPGVPLAIAWKRRGIPYVLDTGDAISAMARTSGIHSGWRLPIIYLLEKAAHRNALGVVVRGTRHRELLERHGLNRVAVIRDGYGAQSSVDPGALAALRRDLQLDGRFVLGVMGSLVYSPRLEICYGWDLVDALALLRDLPVVGLVIGDGNGREWLLRRAQKAGVAYRIILRGRIPYERVPTELRLMDAAMSTQTNNLAGQVRTTGKLPEYMAAERYVLASRVGEARLLLPESMLIDYDGEVDAAYPGRIANKVRELFQRPALLEERTDLPRRVQEHCDYERLGPKWLLTLRDWLTAADSPA